MRQRVTLEPKTKNQTSLRTRLLKYGGGGIILISAIGIGIWLYLQIGQQEEGMASSGSNPPVNDTKAQAEWLTDLYEDQSAWGAYTTANATGDAQTGSCFTNGAQNGVWFKFQALYADATITLKTGGGQGSLQNAELALLDNGNNEVTCATGTGSNDVTLNATGLSPDAWYYLLVDTKNPSDTGSFTLYINNVSPTKYYTRDKGDWDDNANWSTSGFNGASAGSMPGKANVVFIKDLDGSLKIDGYAAECAGIVMTSGNKESILELKNNGDLNIYGRFHMEGTGSKELELQSDQATLSVQDSFLAEMKAGNKKLKIDLKNSDVDVKRTFKVEHSNGTGVEVNMDDNTTLDIDDDFLVYNGGGYNGLELEARKTDITVGGKTHWEYNGGSGDVKFEYHENGTFTVADNFGIYHNGGTNKFEVEMKNNITVNVSGDFSYLFDNGSSKTSFDFKDNSNMTVGGDFTMDMNGGNNKFEIGFQDNVNVNASGNASFSMSGGSSGLDMEVKKNAHLTFGGNLTTDKSGGSSALVINIEDNSHIEAGGDVSANHTGGSNGVELTIGKSNQVGHVKAGGDFMFGSNAYNATEIEVVDNSYLEVKGDVVSAGTRGKLEFKDNASMLKLTGNGVQHLVGEANSNGLEISYRNVLVNNTYSDSIPAIILDGPIHLEEQIALVDGIVQTTSTELLTLGQNITVVGGSDSSFVDGPLNKIGSSDFEFPIGTAGVYAPMMMHNYTNTSSNNEFQVQYFFQGYPDTSTEQNLDHVSNIEYWDVQKVNGSSNLKVQLDLYWMDGLRSGINDLPDLTVAHYDGNMWQALEPTTANGSIPSGNIKTDDGYGNFGAFTFGSMGGGNVLPIELTSFDATAQGNGTVLLSWETEMEINNDYFTLERSTDGDQFREIGTVQGAGNSDVPQQYSFVDENPQGGVNYYRLKQTDFDGKFEYFPVEQVELAEQSTVGSLEITEVYPVPITNQFTIHIECERSLDANVSLVNMSGSQFPITTVTLSAGMNTIRSGNVSHLPKGTYILTIATPDKVFTRKLVKAK